MTTLIETMLLSVIAFVTARPAEPKRPDCPQPRAVEHLLWRMARRDRAALAALYDQTSSLPYGVALRMTGDRTAAEEVTSAVYEEAWQNASSLAEGVCFLSWLAETTREHAFKRRHAMLDRPTHAALLPRAVLASQNGEEASPLPNEWASWQQRSRAALAMLAPEERAVVELAYFSGHKVSEIGRQFGIPDEQVKSLLRSGIMTFRCAIQQNVPDIQQ